MQQFTLSSLRQGMHSALRQGRLGLASPPKSVRPLACRSAEQPDDTQPTSRRKGAQNEGLTNADALAASLEEVSLLKGRRTAGAGFTQVMGDTTSMDKWRQLDDKVNEYPCVRSFKAIGEAGDGFREAMVKAVEDVVGKVHEECVATRPSRNGRYVTVSVGPVVVATPEQVIAVYKNMQEDKRLRYQI